MTTRLLVGILTPAMRAIRLNLHFGDAPMSKTERRGTPSRRPVEAGPCRESKKTQKSHALEKRRRDPERLQDAPHVERYRRLSREK
jgi:hypothetical protein